MKKPKDCWLFQVKTKAQVGRKCLYSGFGTDHKEWSLSELKRMYAWLGRAIKWLEQKGGE